MKNDKLTMHDEIAHWYKTRMGDYVAHETNKIVKRMVNDIFGFYVLELGVNANSFIQSYRIKSCFSLSLKASHGKPSVYVDYDFLPIMFDNIDLVVASHVLELSTHPHQVLREIDRILLPEGHCILIGFNSLHYWRWTRMARRITGHLEPFRFYSPSKIKEWLSVLGFEILACETVGRHSHHITKHFSGYLPWIESWEKWLIPYGGGVYIIHAKKQECAPLFQKKKWQTAFVPNTLVGSAGTVGALKK